MQNIREKDDITQKRRGIKKITIIWAIKFLNKRFTITIKRNSIRKINIIEYKWSLNCLRNKTYSKKELFH